MAWTAILTADIQTRMTDTELSKYNAIGLGSGQTSGGVMNDVATDVTELIRGFIKACPRNGLAPLADGAYPLPSVLHSPALDIIVVELMKRVGGVVTDVSDVRVAAYNSAMALMDKIADCRFGIPKPATESTDAYYDDRGGYGYNQQLAISSGKEVVDGVTKNRYTEL
tara:strand:- start:2793 stop:3296 length:504 start_codon:yes stop_codon:yes gene_type:complete